VHTANAMDFKLASFVAEDLGDEGVDIEYLPIETAE
jgi:hypothetical protein